MIIANFDMLNSMFIRYWFIFWFLAVLNAILLIFRLILHNTPWDAVAMTGVMSFGFLAACWIEFSRVAKKGKEMNDV